MNDVKAYEKNLSDYEGTFDVDDCGELLENKTNSLLILEAEKIREDSRSALKRNIVTRLLAITADDIAEGESIECRAGSFSDIAVLFDGRKKDKKSVYYYNHPSKTMLLRLLAALGKEDEIGTMMIKAGYWDETADWIIHPGAEKSDYLDASDLMIIYMIKYRNQLLRRWAKRLGKDERKYLDEMREKFPFQKMMLEISDEIEKYFEEYFDSKLKPYEMAEVRKYFLVPNKKKNNAKYV